MLWKFVLELINILGVDVFDLFDVFLVGIRVDVVIVNWMWFVFN